jgi:transcriptional regulator with XRE-family HTH domain
MPATPIQRLACALKARPYRERQQIAKASGVGLSAVARALAGQQVKPDVYLKLCAALGIGARTGEAVPVRVLGAFDWRLFALGFHLTRNMKHCHTVRQASKVIGISPATISRLENVRPVSISAVLAVCEFMGVDPEHYCAEREKFNVKRFSETNVVAA